LTEHDPAARLPDHQVRPAGDVRGGRPPLGLADGATDMHVPPPVEGTEVDHLPLELGLARGGHRTRFPARSIRTSIDHTDRHSEHSTVPANARPDILSTSRNVQSAPQSRQVTVNARPEIGRTGPSP